MGELRESKKRATKQRISDVATAMFTERGFEMVTVEEIAAAAGVSRMTVFNYFPRKEDLFLDREDDIKQRVREALAQRPEGQSGVEALRHLVGTLREHKHPFARVSGQTVGWWRVVEASPSLRARVRELADEAALGLAVELAGPKADGRARLVAGMIILAWRTAHAEAVRIVEGGGSVKNANAAFIALVDQGLEAAGKLEASAGMTPRAG